MSAAASPGPADAAVFAARLLPLASSVLAELPLHARGACLEALDAFLEAPAPAAFLRAWRTLQEARHARRARAFQRRRDVHELPAALDLLMQVPQMPERIPAELAHLEADGTAAARIRALAALMGAHSELKARVDAAAERRGRQLEAMKASLDKPARGRARPARGASR